MQRNWPIPGDNQSTAKPACDRYPHGGNAADIGFVSSTGRSRARGSCVCNVGRAVGIAVIAFVVICATNQNVVADETTPITCAIIPDGSFDSQSLAFVDLLEARLAESSDLNVLSRSTLENIKAEHALGLALGSDANESRRRAGAILRANLLAMLQIRKVNNESVLDIEISETQQGLRLSSVTLNWDDARESLAKTIASRVAIAAQSVRTGLKYVVAVPPFESGDFDYESAHLKNGLAMVTESVLSTIPGVLVADLSNCEKLAREIAVSEGPESIQRAMPLYVIGRFETKKIDEKPKIDLQIDLNHGDMRLASATTNGIDIDNVAQFVRSAALQIAASMTGTNQVGQLTVKESVAEADLLEQRLAAFRATGEWEQVIQLAEACLLLDPEREHLHWKVFEAINRLYVEDRSLQLDRIRYQWILRALVHLEYSFRDHESWPSLPRGRIHAFFTNSEPRGRFRWNKVDESFNELIHECQLAKWRVLFVLMDHLPDSGRSRNMIEATKEAFVRDLVYRAVRQMFATSVPRKYRNFPLETVAKVVCGLDRTHGSLPAQFRIIDLSRKRTDDFDRLLNIIHDRSTGSARFAVEIDRIVEARMAFDDEETLVEHIQKLVEPRVHHPYLVEQIITRVRRRISGYKFDAGLDCDKPIVIGDIRFTPIEFEENSLKWSSNDTNWLTFGSDFEVLHDANQVFLLREPSVLVPCPKITSSDRIDDVVWDGRYLWISKRSATQPVTVYDPQGNEVVAMFSSQDGLPSADLACKLAPLGVGEVLVAGAFGRSWLATLSLPNSRNSEKMVKILHKAKTIGDISLEFDPQSTDLAYLPRRAYTIPRDGTSQPWVLLFRSFQFYPSGARPLLVDVEAGSVQVAPKRWLCDDRNGALDETAFGWAWCHPQHEFLRQSRHHPDSSRNPPIATLRLGQKIHSVYENWVTLDLETDVVERCTEMPKLWWFGGLVDSQFHGLVRYAMSGEPRGPMQVSFDHDKEAGIPECVPLYGPSKD